MKAAVRVICRPETALGFALSGLQPIEATTGDAAAASLAGLAATPGKGGIVLIESALHGALPPTTRRQILRDGAPLLMPFPGPEVAAGAAHDEELLEVLRRAIGYRLRLR